ncbi:hypothetical protein TrispH2_010105 [Trichoplax sp. H2]|uniref:Uncharacterized protein n=1 Tax=Trichoplax adhaerens TaxID=10228 RepID=B3S5X5_TRIAD|nr:predicted protein [Trichoplax adhaerens]EDV21886.1 predicted protein [Trichoplax adhaerens]RDD39057.1 hypothetical protein TrispH2_010105 [Trichoplax sp. H2]|eukprot:XP_002115523.1 predicted protein [Trichoplax adhaerens]
MAEKLGAIAGICLILFCVGAVGFYFCLDTVMKMSELNTYKAMQCSYQDGRIMDSPYRQAVVDAAAFEKNASDIFADVTIAYPYSQYMYANNASLYEFLTLWQTSTARSCYVDVKSNSTRKPAVPGPFDSATSSIIIISMITCILSLCGSSFGLLMIVKAKLTMK